MATTFTWDELDYKIDMRPFEWTAERTGLVPYDELWTAIGEIFPVPLTAGQAQVTVGAGVSFPGLPALFADAIHIERQTPKNTGSTTQSFDTLPTYENATVTVKYVTKKWIAGNLPGAQEFNPDPVQLLQQRWAIGGEFLTLAMADTKRWKAVPGDPVSDEVKLSKFIPTIEHQITWPYVVWPPFAAIRACVGKINSLAMTFQTGISLVGTLLFLGAELERQVLSDGTRAWSVTYRFSEKLLAATSGVYFGWNVLYNPASNIFDILTDTNDVDGDLDNQFPYEQANLYTLFQASISG